MTGRPPFKALIAGGGPAALEAVLTLRDVAPDIRVELLVPEREYVYRPLSVVEPFARPSIRRYSYAHLAELGVDIRHDKLGRVESEARTAWTAHGEELIYDALLVATGAQKRRAIPRVLMFGGPEDVDRMHGLVQDVEGGYVRRLAFVAPSGVNWTLPLYELALQMAARAHELCLDRTRVTIISHEQRALEVFGHAASDLMEELLDAARIHFISGDVLPAADRTIALPVPSGHRTPGLPVGSDDFLVTDAHGRVPGVEGVWAAGDCTDAPIKQGGLATQQAAAAARSIAAAVVGRPDADVVDPVLRAMFVAGRQAYFLRRRLDGIDPGQASSRALWWPPAKISGERLASFLDRLDLASGAPGLERVAVEHSG
ncbi:MAG: sulfide:quinone oxidoreductase [Solirubrobacteraceae bacterium]|jgi:sulfide:quinone oxidoreductase|nr:sulfide:quinone oxidoreductase [Solirubrobacteraceae bacterium]